MKNTNKYIILYVLFALSSIGFYYLTYTLANKSIDFQKQILIQQAQTHYNSQVNTRKWNDAYGGVYVFPKDGQKPSPYLKDNTLKTADNRTLIKINPSLMTKELSEIENLENFHFRITSLNPINPNNKVTPFEKKALEYFQNTKQKEYYEFDKNSTFNYMGALFVTKSCLECHQEKDYKVGDIRGGISIALDSSEYTRFVSDIESKRVLINILVGIFLLIITLLVRNQLKYNNQLKSEVKKRIKEIKSTKKLLQQILDEDLSLLLVTDGINLVFVNQPLLDFFEFNSIDEFKGKYNCISETFEKVEHHEFLKPASEGQQWINYLLDEQHQVEIKVAIKASNEYKYFKPHAKTISIDDKTLYLIILDEITKHYQKINKLQDEASKDSLTKLFNRGKFDEVLVQELTLAQTTSTPLSIIFLDIDFFKKVNDTLGHHVGDEVLRDVAKLIASSIRDSDFLARWGGEEFVITLQNTTKAKAKTLAEKLRKKVENHTFKNAGKLTISLGVTEYIAAEEKESFIKRVDTALYEAKHTGRNKVVVH